MSLKISDIPLLEKLLQEYSLRIKPEQTKKSINVDTLIHTHEWNQETLAPLDHMEPFGNSNEEPLFVLQDTIIKSVEKVGTRGK
jgi:single-stranded DNA-specific DHH superfamily exonuclease